MPGARRTAGQLLQLARVRTRIGQEARRVRSAPDTNGHLVTKFPAAVWSAIRFAGLDLALLAAAENGGDSAVQSVVAAT